MSRQLTKSQKAKKRIKAKKKQIKKMEKEDSLGIIRNEISYTMNPKVFIILKIISIISIPLIYFIYSPFLMLAILFSISTYFFAIMTERKLNHTFIKANHIKIPKFDAIIGIFVIIISFFSMAMSFNTKRKMPQDNFFSSYKITLSNLGSCYTGKRGHNLGMGFSPKEPPKNLPPMMAKPEKFKMDMDDLPIEVLFSIVTSTINTVLIFLIPISSSITLFIYYKKKKRFTLVMNDKISNTIPEISNEEFERIFMFGYEEIHENATENSDSIIHGKN